MENMTKSTVELSKRNRGQTYYDILGVPTGVGIEHIKDSYRLLTRRTVITDVAYRTLTDPEKRLEYDAWLVGGPKPEAQPQTERAQEERDWGTRGRERCSCGKILNVDDEWHCQECWGRLEYYVVFDMFGGYIVHDSQMPVVAEPDGQTYQQAPYGSLFGPFPKKKLRPFSKKRTN
jgi:hypothetical protein